MKCDHTSGVCPNCGKPPRADDECKAEVPLSHLLQMHRGEIPLACVALTSAQFMALAKEPGSLVAFEPTTGPGTELRSILAALGIESDQDCGCKAMERRMNRWGVAGCQTHRAEIVAHLQAKASEWHWPGAWMAGPLGLLVDRAIARAESVA